MNGDDQGPTLGDFNPSWMQTGGISGDSQVYEAPFDQDDAEWDTNAWTRDQQDIGEVRSGGACGAESDESKTYVQVKKFVGGEWTCSWEPATTCP